MRRYELTDERFALIADLMPANGRRGGQWNDCRPGRFRGVSGLERRLRVMRCGGRSDDDRELPNPALSRRERGRREARPGAVPRPRTRGHTDIIDQPVVARRVAVRPRRAVMAVA
jgi:hypothetical protein